MDRRRDGFGTRERYAGGWAKDMCAGTGVLPDAHGKAWDVLFSPRLARVESFYGNMKPLRCNPSLVMKLGTSIQTRPDLPPRKSSLHQSFSTLCSPRRAPAPGALPSHPAFYQPSDSVQAGLEKSRAEAGEAVIARESLIKATFVWEPKVKHAASTG